MIRINFIEPKETDWKNWIVKCKRATKKLIEDVQKDRPIVISKQLYKEQKSVFFDLDNNFYGKCAYCESLIVTTHPGDIEHFRPKNAITDLNNQPIILNTNGQGHPHPGYYWLAYELTNLLPSCIDCNRPSSGNSQGKKIGKWSKFPVKNGNAIKPGDERNEQPLLINPATEDPAEHLEIDQKGILHPHKKSDRGDMCINVFGLNDRIGLVKDRYDTYKDVRKLCEAALVAYIYKSPDVQEHFETISEYKQGKRPYSIAAKRAIEEIRHENAPMFNRL